MPVDVEDIVDKVLEIAPWAIGGYIIYKWFIEPKTNQFDPFNPLR